MNCRGSNPIKGIMKLYAMLLCAVVPGLLGAAVFHVGIGDSYPFNSIQDAINTATHGDTIYVHPGVYIGSLYINEKQLYISSLFSLTNDPADIENTVLSGNYGIFGIVYRNSVGPGYLIGFTIRDARNFNQAPLNIGNNTLLNVEHCVITNNRKTHNSANIYIAAGSVITLKGCKIHENYSMGTAGISKTSTAILIFDRQVRNSIYNNYGSHSSDINYRYSSYYNTVPLDTLFLAVASSGVPDIHYYRGINHVVADSIVGHTVTHDIYVAPWGDNASDGATPQNPMRTVRMAARKAFPADGQMQTIHVAPGVYAFNDFEDMNIGLRPNVAIIGDPYDLPVFDAQGAMFAITRLSEGNRHFENLIIKNASRRAIGYFPTMQPGEHYIAGSVVLKNLRLIDNFSDGVFYLFENVLVSNVISTCSPGNDVSISMSFASRNVRIENSVFSHRSDATGYHAARGITFSRTTLNLPGEFTANVINTLFHNINTYCVFFQGLGMAVQLGEGVHVNLINCLIIDNQSPNNSFGSISIRDSSSVSLYNTIVWNNRPNNITMMNPQTHLAANHSLIENGAQNYTYPSWLLNDGNIVYGDSNLPSGSIPLFVGLGPYKYMPIAGSCTIDSGTLVLPAGVTLPDYDLAGNPRIYGAEIDLGPYEWQGLEFDFTFIQTVNQVTFIPLANQDIYEIFWDFDLDGVIDSNELAPTHLYQANGIYSVGCYINGGMAGRVIREAITVTGLSADDDLASPNLSLHNYPNPFNPSTTIVYVLPQSNRVSVSIFNVKGQIVKTLVNEYQSSGWHSVFWDGRDDKGILCASGIYYCRIIANGKIKTRKMLLLK